jgi:hypothetical protein
MFLVLTVVFWLLALGAWVLSVWFDQSGWSVLGTAGRIVGLLLAALTAIGTGIFLVTWTVQMVRAFRYEANPNERGPE